MDLRKCLVKLNDIDLNKLHVFRVVAESTNLKEAGAQLLRTPSAISQSLASLERFLGMALFRRVGIRLELTENGQMLYEQIKSNEQALEFLFETMGQSPKSVGGLVSIGLPMGYSASALGENLSDLLLQYSELQLRLRFMLHAELADSLEKGRLEMALSLQPLKIWSRGIKSYELRKEHMVLAIPSTLKHQILDQSSTVMPLVDYFQKPLLIETWFKHHRLSSKKLHTQVKAYGASLDHVLEFVKKGVGCAFVPRLSIEDEIAKGLLVEHPLDKKSPLWVTVWLNSHCLPNKLTSSANLVWKTLMR